ncbi:MAG: flagellar biosynthesis protein FlhF [Candidatus Wallbacteria bacterium GWC2_49_35]|uniref:Flagellar biosynthesis protein FlhF n=1 Tax=Candidatus Wallbacteria bacterium GWC2_49_35 TaxID=1817813 RepID=A0A1F7WJT0_9BACT|nr:MAG: flagellar biosynthesis protein FlhF [Candidatus Wallbacteria bacterium GWC2_49_35]
MSLSRFYIAPNYFEAMKAAKAELGEDLLLINQRKVKVDAFFGFFGGKTMVEVEVQVDSEQAAPRRNAKQKNSPAAAPQKQTDEFIDPRSVYATAKQPQQQQTIETIKRNGYSQAVETAAAQQSFQPRPSPVRDDVATDKLMDMMRLMQQQLDTLSNKISKHPQQQVIISPPPAEMAGASRAPIYPPNLQRVYELLYRAEFSEPLLNKVMIDLQTIPEASKDDWEKLKEHLRKRLVGLCKTAPQITLNDAAPEIEGEAAPKMPKLVAFVGTTGVGKTTTLAKIATNLVLKAKKKAMLLTIDTYRVAATHQISTYADIIGVPYEIIYKESDFLPCIMRHQDVDVILIDTAGRSQKNNLEVLELRKFLYPGNNIEIEIFLVISSTIKYRDMQDIIKNFGKVNFNKLIFTKTDETTTWGPLLCLAAEAEKPIIYISNGQNVPDDIMPAEANYVVKKIIDNEENA